ncbi:transporter [Aestuariivirga sp.]|jgi:hypothetical protein|uniref:SphA family protein n=1 Tax=Aestuariivirga sp. TaxID=2650926 RepID=UPI003784405F
MLLTPAQADEGGVSFWLPGQYGSFAAIAPEPGFSIPTVTYYYQGEMKAGKTLRQGTEIAAEADASFLAQFIIPTYTPDASILGGRPSFSLALLPAYSETSAEISAGGLSASRSDSVSGFGDLYPTVQLFWNAGVSNWMVYGSAGLPVGSYEPDRLANVGTGHAAIDVGGAYTYLNPETGWEMSATAGVTFNFENPDTYYTSGTSIHLDVGAAKLLSEQFFAGVVGYAYQQVAADEGTSTLLGDFKSSVIGIGPQIGYNFMAGDVPIYTNLRGYLEVAAENRPKGGSLFLTVNLPVSALMRTE